MAQTLHRSGINMGDDLAADDLDYNSEKSESRQARLINSLLLDSVGKYSLNVSATTESKLNPEAEAQLYDFISKQSQKYSKWGFKDPRTTLTYPTWKPYLGEHKLILVYRPIESVWRHYTRDRLSGFKPFSSKCLRRGLRAIDAWVGYNSKLIEYISDGAVGTILLNYDSIMTDGSTLEKLGKFTNSELVDARQGQPKALTKRERIFFTLHRLIYRVRFGGKQLQEVQQCFASHQS